MLDGRNRLLILDGLERHPGYEGCLGALQHVPAGSRVLAVGRGKAPLLPGYRVELDPVDRGELAALSDADFLVRLAAHPHEKALTAACRRDLLAARILMRLESWPPARDLGETLRPQQGQTRPGSSRLLVLCAKTAVARLGPGARQVLAALLLPGSPVFKDMLARIAGRSEAELSAALPELQWAGLVDATGGEQRLGVPTRLQGVLAGMLLDPATVRRLVPRWALAAQTFLAEAAEALQHIHSPEPWNQGTTALAWGPASGPAGVASAAETGHTVLRRLGAERAGLVELSWILAESGDVRTLTRLIEEARPLAALPWLADLHLLLAGHLYAAARTLRDEVAQAKALNRLGAALLACREVARATPLLERALERLAHHDGWDTLWETYLLLSRAYESQDQLDAAGNLLNSAVELAYQLGDGSKLVTALRAISRIWSSQGVQHEMAGQVLPRAVSFLERREQRQQAALVRALLAECQSHSGKLDDAQATYRQAMEAFLDAGDQSAAAVVSLGLATVLCRQGQPDAAWRLAQDAASVLGESGDAHLAETARAIELIARWSETHQRPDLALEAYAQLRALFERARDTEGQIRVLDLLGGVYFQLGRQADSTRCYEERLRLLAED